MLIVWDTGKLPSLSRHVISVLILSPQKEPLKTGLHQTMATLVARSTTEPQKPRILINDTHLQSLVRSCHVL